MGKSIRRVLLTGAMLLTMLPTLPMGGPTASTADGCSHFLFSEDAALNGWDCPELPSLSATGVVREQPEGKRGRVREIVDGDTLHVSFGDTFVKVRIYSVDTPEIYSGPQCYGAEASAYVASLIPVGSLIWFEQGLTKTDRYDRELYYVWFTQGEGRYRLLQDAIVRDGFGEVVIYPPDDRYADWLFQGQTDALNAGRGLWSACGGAGVPLEPPTPTPEPYVAQAEQPMPAAQPVATGCDPSYPSVCISPASQVGDLDCGDISYRRFTVLQPDPHNFDGDFDGVGCESG